jgi:hypothetical protein
MDQSRTEQNRAALSASGTVNATGEFEVLAITAGEGNGWQFSAAALRESLALWDGAECFIDHRWTHSLRDLAGVLCTPEWDAASQGVKCRLRPLGPAGPVLAELGRQLLADGAPQPRVGFSADVVFSAQGQQVEKILRVLSVDLVFNPARGGAFLRALNHLQGQGVYTMETQDNAVKQASVEPPVESGPAYAQQMSAYLLETGLTAARLPAPVSERIRKQFAGQVFEPAALTRAVDDARALISELTGPGVVQGSGRISAVFSSEDQFSAALHDLLGAERPNGLAQAHPARLSGVRELYTLMTGDNDFTGGYHPERAMFATSADLPGVLKNALNKLIAQEWRELGRSGYRWWEQVVSVEHFSSLQEITGILVGEVTLLPSVAEAAPYTALGVTDSPEVGSWAKYGGYIGLTLEMFERDETHRLRQYPRKLASASLRRISSLVGSVFTTAGGLGPNMSDGSPVFDAVRGNLGSDALNSAAWEAASGAIYNQQMLVPAGATPPVLALDARYLLVPRGLRLTAQRILYPSWEREANIVSENLQQGAPGDVITCPEFSDPNDWAAVADPRLAPAIILGERFGVQPEIIIADQRSSGAASGALFTNDEIRMKVRQWVSVFVADYRPLYKANVV